MSRDIDPTVLTYGHQDEYYVPRPSMWPLLTSLSAATLVTGMFLMFNGVAGAMIVLLLGLCWQLANMFGWWRDVVHESETGSYKTWEDVSFRWGMAWFIFSEVMFFAGFFAALFYARASRSPTWLRTPPGPSGPASRRPGRLWVRTARLTSRPFPPSASP